MNQITLTDEQLKLLKEALLCAEMSRQKEKSNWQDIKNLHIFIDSQLKSN